MEDEGRLLAALLRLCDRKREFDYLPVETPRSIQRMHRFLQQNRLDPRTTSLPFIVLVSSSSTMDTTKRSVLQGATLQQWLTALVDAFLAEPDTTPAGVMQNIIQPHMDAHIIRLVQYATTTPTPINNPDAGGPPTTTSNKPSVVVMEVDDVPPPPREAYIEEIVDEYDIEDAAGAHETVSSVPVRQSRTAHHTVNASSAMLEYKERENMLQQRKPVAAR